MNYMRHPHKTEDGTTKWHTHLIDDFEETNPHTWADHQFARGIAPKNPEPTHPMSNAPDGLVAGSYEKMFNDYATMAAGFTTTTLHELLHVGRRDEWKMSQDPHKLAVAWALGKEMEKRSAH